MICKQGNHHSRESHPFDDHITGMCKKSTGRSALRGDTAGAAGAALALTCATARIVEAAPAARAAGAARQILICHVFCEG